MSVQAKIVDFSFSKDGSSANSILKVELTKSGNGFLFGDLVLFKINPKSKNEEEVFRQKNFSIYNEQLNLKFELPESLKFSDKSDWRLELRPPLHKSLNASAELTKKSM